MDEKLLIEMLVQLTDEVIRLSPDPDTNTIAWASRGLLRIQKDRLVRELHRVEFEREREHVAKSAKS